MKQKSTNRSWLLPIALVWLLLLAVACSDDRTDDGMPEETVADVPVELSLAGTRTGGAVSDMGSDEERRITRIRILTFSAVTGKWEQTQMYSTGTEGWPSAGNDLRFTYLGRSGRKQILVVANETDALAVWLDGMKGRTADEVRCYLTEASATVPTIPTDPSAQAAWPGFLMTGETVADVSALQSASAPNHLSVAIDRAVARIDLHIMKSGMATGTRIQLTKVTLVRGADRVPLFPVAAGSGSPSGVTTSLTASAASFNPTGGVVPEPGTGVSLDVAAFYAYENLALADSARATCLDIEALIDDAPNQVTRSARVFIGASEDNTQAVPRTLYNVQRNTFYKMNVDINTVNLDQLVVHTRILDWNVENTKPDAGIRIIEQPKDMVAIVNSLVTFSIQVKSQSDAPCTYTWYVDNQEVGVTQDPEFEYLFDGGSKDYWCRVEDELGNIMFSQTARITGKS